MTASSFVSLVRDKYPDHNTHDVIREGYYTNGMDSGRCACGVLFLIGYDPTLNWGGSTGCNMIAAKYPTYISRKPLLDIPIDQLVDLADLARKRSSLRTAGI